MKSHKISVSGVGDFEFRQRTMRDEMRIAAEYSRLTEGVATIAPWFDALATRFATLKVLLSIAPEGWDIEELDPLDSESYRKIAAVFEALASAEARFRRQPGQSGAEAGERS